MADSVCEAGVMKHFASLCDSVIDGVMDTRIIGEAA